MAAVPLQQPTSVRYSGRIEWARTKLTRHATHLVILSIESELAYSESAGASQCRPDKEHSETLTRRIGDQNQALHERHRSHINGQATGHQCFPNKQLPSLILSSPLCHVLFCACSFSAPPRRDYRSSSPRRDGSFDTSPHERGPRTR